MISDVYELLYDFTCFLAPARSCSKAVPILFKNTPVRIKCRRFSSPTSICPLWLRNQVALLQWFISPFKASLTLGPHPPPPLPPPRRLLRHKPHTQEDDCQTSARHPLHKLTIEKVGVGSVGCQLQDLDDVSTSLTKACGYQRSRRCI